MAPSRRVIFFLLLAKRYRITALTVSNRQSITDSSRTCSGEMTDDIPRMNRILNRLEPMAFPSARLLSPLRVATMEVTSSGREVPTAMIVRPIKF